MSQNELETNLTNRRWLLRRLRAEVVGPDPVGSPLLSPEAEAVGLTWDTFPFTADDDEEILWQDPPTKRYGAGILFPSDTRKPEQDEADFEESQETELPSHQQQSTLGNRDDLQAAERILARADREDDSSEDAVVSGANDFMPSSIGVSFLGDLNEAGTQIAIELVSVSREGNDDGTLAEGTLGRYVPVTAEVSTQPTEDKPERKISRGRKVYIRRPILDQHKNFPRVLFTSRDLLDFRVMSATVEGHKDLKVTVVSRPWRNSDSYRLITASLQNLNRAESKDIAAVFQAGIRASSLNGEKWIRPYPEHSTLQSNQAGIEDQISQLNYRNTKSFGIGHGAAADWLNNEGNDLKSSVWTDTMPVFEMPTTTPDLRLTDSLGNPELLKISMRKLSALDSSANQFEELVTLQQSYRDWITELEEQRNSDAEIIASQASVVILERIKHVAARIDSGITMLQSGSDKHVLKAFELANLAMFLAQSRARSTRQPIWGIDGKDELSFSHPYQAVDFSKIPPSIGNWRPFQIAFLLMSLDGLVDEESYSRNEVDLIWFPTGGGKTEAYLGAIAFLLFYRRLTGRESFGVTVLMRYTLRLLTAQQFERATTLFCAMEYVRLNLEKTLGPNPFNIGLFVGAVTSPNTRSDAKSSLSAMVKRPEDQKNPFILRRCPWCAAAFGVFETSDSGAKETKILGYERYQDTVIFRCPDSACDFSAKTDSNPLAPRPDQDTKLPVTVIDEDLVANPPHLLVATVDKFALLAWDPKLRSFFGLDSNGEQLGSPPALIIQDELHLISGPLGTIVGAYETVIEHLCTTKSIKPKIVASTATISNAEEQILNLYARKNTVIFPPAGFDASDSFFARESKDIDGKLAPGRLYVGIMAPGHLSLQTTQARVFASLLQWPNTLEGFTRTSEGEKLFDKDPWWTLLSFYNSLRELGTAATILVSDTRDYLRVIVDRHGLDYGQFLRKSLFPTELTSRIPSDKIPEILNQLENRYAQFSEGETQSAGNKAIDVCLASSIIEVGVDVPRLSLMTIVGQPKTTAQYIQVSSRIGRRLDRPGLVNTLYSSSKARDRSHYERFKSYHQKIFSNVEPTSVTPFSIPAIERTLHALAVALVRQKGATKNVSSDPSIDLGWRLKNEIEQMVENRVNTISPKDHGLVMKKLSDRLLEWEYWQPSSYGTFNSQPQDAPLMHLAGKTPPEEWKKMSWPTLTSMRGVDAAAEAEVTQFYNRPAETE